MDEALCKEIQYRVERYLAPGAKNPGIIRLSNIWGLWRDKATKEEVKKCLEQAGAIVRRRGEDVFLIYPTIAKEAYERWRNDFQRQMDELKEIKQEIEVLETEIITLNELREIWLAGLGEAELGDLENKVSQGIIASFISKNFQVEESRIMSSKGRLESSRKELEEKIRVLKTKIENLREMLEYV